MRQRFFSAQKNYGRHSFDLARKKFSKDCLCWPSHEALEQATPEQIAFYRASRLKCDVAVDLCCGIGMDSIALAKYCKKVYAVDIDNKALICAKNNAKCCGVENIEFIHADCFSLNLRKLNADIVFADPSRRLAGRRVKNLMETKPSVTELVRFINKQRINDFCIEVSRELEPEEIPYDCEIEYISLNKELNCATLYFGALAKCKRSAVLLPSQKCLSSDSKLKEKAVFREAPDEFIYRIDEGIIKAGLWKELLKALEVKANLISENYATSGKFVQSDFFNSSFRVLRKTSAKFLVSELNSLNAGKAVFHGRFLPELHALLKEDMKSKLKGTKKLHVLCFNKDNYFLCEKLY
ncbi:MAG: trimethylguanosine synthase [Candidatus Diapherotrites archaeon]|nr:trimethylguanosine synthase [Candidatus Diapherotrites archaeon]